jgi:PAS domain S-box-containing protein
MHLGSRIIGLLQISDRRLGRFSPETIASMERLADSMATFVAHRQAQEDLRMQEEQFRCLVESSENHLFILDRAGRYIMSNGRVSQFGLTDGDRLVGRCLAQVHAPDVSLVYQRHLEQVFVSDAAVEFEHTLPTPEGERLHVDTLYPLHRDGKVWAVGGVCRDVTENRRAEKERQWHVQELARMERITTMNELASALVHELNQPLTGILSNAQAAQHLLNHDPPDVVELRDALQDIVADDKRAAEIIHRTRALIRRETSVRERINLNDLLESVARYVHSDMVINGTKILTCPGPGLPDVMGDRVQLEQVLMNLIRNGVQAMRASDAPDREIRIATGSGNGSVVKVSVRDRGPGISPSAINLIFEPLFTTREEGVGLGLAICRSIVQAHGGRIWAENNAEGGSTLSFELPA